MQRSSTVAKQAKKDGLQWAWIDTCCTDKTSSAELSEAINSMFEWYAQSSVCYVYLSDISLPKDSPDMLTAEDLGRSRWVSRGWTLQELIAPDYVRFFSDDWTECGNRRALATIIHRVTNIAPEILDRPPGSEGLESLAILVQHLYTHVVGCKETNNKTRRQSILSSWSLPR